MPMFWVVCARANETKIRKAKASALVVLNVVDKLYWPFKPEKGFQKKGKYGKIEKDNIHVYHILRMSDDEEEVDQWMKDPRSYQIKVGPRLSLEESVYKLRDFDLKVEAMASEQDVEKPKVTAAQNSSYKKIVEKFGKSLKKSADPKTANQNEKEEGTTAGNSSDRKRNHMKDKPEDTTAGNSSDNKQNDPKRKPEDTTASNSSRNEIFPLKDKHDLDTHGGKPADIVLKEIPSLSILKGDIVPVLEIARPSSTESKEALLAKIEILEGKVALLTERNDNLTQELKRVREDNSNLQGNYMTVFNAKQEMEVEYLAKTLDIAQNITDQLKHNNKGNSEHDAHRSFHCKLKDFHDATGTGGAMILDDQIFMGMVNDKPCHVSKDTLNHIHMNEETFILRTFEMLKCLWPSDYHFWTLSGPDDRNPTFKKIPKEIKKSIQVIFNLMTWDQEELLKTKEASVAKRGKGVTKNKDKDEDDLEEDVKDVTVTMPMVSYGLRKATYKARTEKQVKVVGKEKLKKGQKRGEDSNAGTEKPEENQTAEKKGQNETQLKGGSEERKPKKDRAEKRQHKGNEGEKPKKKKVVETDEPNAKTVFDGEIENLDKSISDSVGGPEVEVGSSEDDSS